jgi:cholesterol transport system auxiliary component
MLNLIPRALGQWVFTLCAVAGLAACATSHPPTVHTMVRYDLGPVPLDHAGTVGVAGNASPATLPVVKVVTVTAPAALDTDRIQYRLTYLDPLEPRTYASSRWSATPAQLMTERLRDVLATHVHVLDAGDPEHAPLLKVTLRDFSQRFTAPGHGDGVVSVRATLKIDDRLMAQRDFYAIVPGDAADAAGGAAAIARAANAVLGAVGDWSVRTIQSGRGS